MNQFDPVVRLRRVPDGEDRYGNPVYVDEVEDLPGARFAPGGVIPPAEPGRMPVMLQPTLYWHNQWPDVVDSDRLTVRDVTYEVDGRPADWRGQNVGGLVVKLRGTVEGTP